MSVPLAVPPDEGDEKTGPGFLFPVQKSERSPTGSVDESVFGQVADWVAGAIKHSLLKTPGEMRSCRGASKQRFDPGRPNFRASCQNRKHIVIVKESESKKLSIPALQDLLWMFAMQESPGRNAGFFASIFSEAASRVDRLRQRPPIRTVRRKYGGDGFLASLHGPARGHGGTCQRQWDTLRD